MNRLNQSLYEFNLELVAKLRKLISSSNVVRADFKNCIKEHSRSRGYKHLMSLGVNLSDESEIMACILVVYILSVYEPAPNDNLNFANALGIAFSKMSDLRFQRIMRSRDVYSLVDSIVRVLPLMKSRGVVSFDLAQLLLDVRFYENDIDALTLKWARQYYRNERLDLVSPELIA